MYTGEVFWCEAIIDVLTETFCCEVVCLKMVDFRKKERKKEIPYIEGKMKDIGARVGYTIL